MLRPLRGCMAARAEAVAALPAALAPLGTELLTAVEAAASSCEQGRQPLEYLRRAPVPVRQLNPVFEDRRPRGAPKSRKEEKEELVRLQRTHKKELRGAAKEVRRLLLVLRFGGILGGLDSFLDLICSELG